MTTKPDWARKAAEKYKNHASIFDDIMDLRFAAILLRAERARARRVVRMLNKFYKQHHALWLAKAGNRPLVQSFKAKADVCDELLRRLK